MSSGVNIKTMSSSSSGIPLPRSLTSLSKHDTKCLSSSLLSPAAQIHQGGQTSSISYSTSTILSQSVSYELPKGTELKIQPSQRAQWTSNGLNRASFAPRSAHSSRHVPKREVLPFKRMQDLQGGSLPQDNFRDLDRHSNKNWRSGHHQFRSLDNGLVEPSGILSKAHQSKEAHQKLTNGNVIWETSTGIQRCLQRQQMKMSSLGVGDVNMIASKSQVTIAKAHPAGRESPRMAATPPFRFRLQVPEDADESSLENVSDCSSDSMEVCCEDLVC
ncbi:uncharacterized protein LOC127646564 [Xyrauchen texanus]|uniref:uncharacterized protein LOC127646564 n=1 Tax=Xyrauchen texanus TaxID=154827 RepID=UPI002241F56F|nr:uncharacterized protein LOC127646564 [Xyrauchen texanus]